MGRGTTPDGNAIFKINMKDNEDIDTVDIGIDSRKLIPEKRIEILEREIEELKKNFKLDHIY